MSSKNTTAAESNPAKDEGSNNLHLLVESIQTATESRNPDHRRPISPSNELTKKRRLSPTELGPVHAINTKFQQSLKLKEQQQAIIESRLISPPAPTDSSAASSQNLTPSNSIRSPSVPIPGPSSKPLLPRPTSPSRPHAHPTPLARLNLPKHNTADPGFYSADPANAKSLRDHHLGPQTAGPFTSFDQRNRTLPPPSPSGNSHPSTSSGNSLPAVATLPQNNALPGPSVAAIATNRRAFLHLFEQVYDTASEDLPKLVATLKDQMRKSSSLLQTLQASGQMIEGLVRSCFRDLQVQYGEKFGTAIADLGKRVEALEARLCLETTISSADAATHSNSNLSNGKNSMNVRDSQPDDVMATLKALMDRIEQLERK